MVHDLPHKSSTTEWWYLKTHIETVDGRKMSLFVAFFRALTHYDESTGTLEYAHSLTWAISDLSRGRYINESLVDQRAPELGMERMDRGEGTKDLRLRRAMREVCEKGHVPYPDKMFEEEVFVATDRLELDFDGNTLRRNDDGSYSLELWNKREHVGATLRFAPKMDAVRHGDDGVVKGAGGEDMFYYFIPNCEVTGQVKMDGSRAPIKPSAGW